MQDPLNQPDFSQSLVETAQAIILVLDTQGRIVSFNPYMEAVCGYRLEEVRGKDWFGTFLPADQQESIKALFLQAIGDIKTKGNINSIVARDGNQRQIEWYDTTLKDADGAVVGLLSIGQDVTERLAIEKNLGIKDAAMDSANEAVAFAGLDGTLTYVNRAFLRLWGCESAESLYGTHVTNFWHAPEQAVQVVTALNETGHWKGELVALRQDGTSFPAEVSASLVIDNQGNPLGMMSIFEDISARKEAESALIRAKTQAEQTSEALLQSERQYRALFDATLEAVLIADDNARYVHANPAACDLLGYELDELLKLGVRDVTPLDEGFDFHGLWQALMQQGSLRGEYVVQRKDGSRIEVEYRAVANFVPGLHLAVMHDISERKQAERALIEAKEQAELASKAKSLFLSRMSHELRTPLNSILGFAQLLDTELDAEQRDKLQYILSSGKHLLDLINDLLDLSKIEANKLEILLEQVALQKRIKDCIDAIHPLALQRGIRIQCDLQLFSNQVVLADMVRLKQVLLNLLSNAVKYNRQGGNIIITGKATAADTFRISIADTGSGIAPEDYPGLFEPFNRLYLKTYAIDGSGIGLALSKQLVELMGGRIGVQSELGQGSTFWIELKRGEPQAAAQAAPPGGLDTGSSVDEKAFKLLYIEDSPSHIRLMEAIFSQQHDLQLYTANTPRLGLEMVQAYNPDLILLDICLPDMDGYQVFDLLNRDAFASHIPVIALSASAMPHEIERGLRSGFRRYLTKPLNISELLRAVKEVLQDQATIDNRN